MILVPNEVRAPIDTEYEFLCERLGLTPVPLDVFYVDPDAQLQDNTPLGNAVRDGNARYGRTAVATRVLALPLSDGDDSPKSVTPPTTWNKYDDLQWPTWRMELWHEVVHQYSDQIGNAWNPLEPAIMKPDGRHTDIGHGAGWWAALTAVAATFSVDALLFSALIDR